MRVVGREMAIQIQARSPGGRTGVLRTVRSRLRLTDTLLVDRNPRKGTFCLGFCPVRTQYLEYILDEP